MERCITVSEKRKITNLYGNRYKKFGRSHKTAGWGSAEDQYLRFELLFRNINPKGKSIIDVGCGLGDLVPFLNKRSRGDFDYLGIDICKPLLDDAKKRFSSDRITFLVGDILEIRKLKSADIVVLSGALNFKIQSNQTYAKNMIKKMFGLAKEVACINFMSSYVDFQTKKNYHYSPETIFRFAKSLTRWVSLYHDYPLWEFTIQLYKHATS